jgi:hypothetical protein
MNNKPSFGMTRLPAGRLTWARCTDHITALCRSSERFEVSPASTILILIAVSAASAT